jgi:hypothetical protein
MRSTLADVKFRLSAPSLGFWVDVRLRSFGDRWLAVAEIANDRELGLGTTPRQALEGALASLASEDRSALLCDPSLFGASAAVATAR